ncbi:hypothetical protein CPT_Merlin95 [Citrobacter phage Merlin]|uniref:Uncharacterized protein n=1 Tax=Citrobacter phage Merlin TaxID=1675602 RepID=A0A0K1LMJ5_9CAUD|nr:hypothetical protein CPT_Merlin95 [Citrobacter phage Merlin]AKU43741.1 hypothetical protein CPT_Merlin95 [Citrobacter phage Merlin]
MGYGLDEDWEYEDEEELGTRYSIMKIVYERNASAKVGAEMYCPYCRKVIVKRSWQHKFCSTPCKDKYWNCEPKRAHRAEFFKGKLCR